MLLLSVWMIVMGQARGSTVRALFLKLIVDVKESLWCGQTRQHAAAAVCLSLMLPVLDYLTWFLVVLGTPMPLPAVRSAAGGCEAGSPCRDSRYMQLIHVCPTC
jgi:hypothetical protein